MSENIQKGIITGSNKGFFDVELADKVVVCKAATKLRRESIAPLPGDTVWFADNQDGTGFITAITERKNFFIRPAVANVDRFVIVAATASPEPQLYNIDKLSAVFVSKGAEVIIAVNKTDLAPAAALEEIYTKCGFKVLELQAPSCTGTNALKEALNEGITVFCGASGVGKSSLLNAMYPKLDLAVGDLSERIMRGKNTTRSTRLFKTGTNAYIADTPGFSMLDFERYDILSFEDIKTAFPEMKSYFGKCRYKKCSHTKEEGCAVIQAVNDGVIPLSRHQSYVAIYHDLKQKQQY